MKNSNLPPWDSLEAAAARPDWQILTQKIEFENPWMRVESYDVIAPTGNPAHYGVTRFRNRAVAVVPLFDDGTVVIVGQQRFALNAYSWELPEGGVPDGEDPLEGAKRELAEEAGLKAEYWREIIQMDLSNSITDEVATGYLATGLTPAEGALDETESLEIRRIPFKDLLKAVISGQVRDSQTVVCALRIHHMATTGDLPPHLINAILG
ncbi:NUDIX hydrolase [Asticcacaulis sp. ZE23SCel15]|uniref:NUDIX domain-containing protein n=1 Tax=Asticcacaulis sp. ZE23SCel15 TaxID=3059027 RepID=UPI00265EA14F|nr:NUDIX hydrolase [Asticcacaulis sp. ZE23SCel15]WKL57414.1 NUDIX hydrolase [Asticcacaulis sp. ZE23SCel15]